MHISSLILSISIALGAVYAVESSSGKLAPVSDAGLNKRPTLVKRDYATTLKYLRAAMASYRKDAITPPSAAFVQLEQSLFPQPVQAAQPLLEVVDPVWAVETEPMPSPSNQQVISSPATPERQDAQHLDAFEPPMRNRQVSPPPPPDSSSSSTYDSATPPEQPAKEKSASPELGNERKGKSLPVNADIEEDDTFDPEEDPDDVDDPPIVNGVAVNREE
ncbi:hypothetical protein [Parasitella parasitica]|uniref:Uncharacterized protein n=1 Tax=Parasitella parasitica TaxID=35722 RepID=A0A0B7NM64_9FUNG|nr:hypothetical protein [Parasitella parasitica]